MNVERFNQGVAMRLKIAGEEYARSIPPVDPTNITDPLDLVETFTRFSTEHAWGAVWPRPGLDLRSRSIATIGLFMVLAGNRNELRLHLRGALRNGFLTPNELGDMLLLATGYAGFQVSQAAAREVDDILKEFEVGSAAADEPDAPK